jgi:hypothetical protein
MIVCSETDGTQMEGANRDPSSEEVRNPSSTDYTDYADFS